MPIQELSLSQKEEVTEEETEEQEKELIEAGPIIMKSIKLDEKEDIAKVGKELENGNIGILDISSLLDKETEDLRLIIENLKETVSETGGDIGRLSETRIMTVPRMVEIQFKE